MAFVTNKKGDNPLTQVDDGMYDAEVTDFQEVENKFKGQLFNPGAPESESNRRNNYDTQYEFDFTLDGIEDAKNGGPLVAKVWANPTTGEKSKLRRILKALDAWEARTENGEVVEGFDDDPENIKGRRVRVLIEEGKITNYLKAK